MNEGNPSSSAERPLVSVIVVNWNTKDLLEDCLASVETHLAQTPHEIIVVDNGSTDGSADLLASRFPRPGSSRTRKTSASDALTIKAWKSRGVICCCS